MPLALQSPRGQYVSLHGAPPGQGSGCCQRSHQLEVYPPYSPLSHQPGPPTLDGAVRASFLHSLREGTPFPCRGETSVCDSFCSLHPDLQMGGLGPDSRSTSISLFMGSFWQSCGEDRTAFITHSSYNFTDKGAELTQEGHGRSHVVEPPRPQTSRAGPSRQGRQPAFLPVTVFTSYQEGDPITN